MIELNGSMLYVPWALPLLVKEIPFTDHAAARKNLRSLLPELKAQSEAYLAARDASSTSKSPSIDFSVHLHSGLDLFLGRGACPSFGCRVAQAQRVVRSVGVIADRVWLTDTFTYRFLDFGRITNAKLDVLLADILVLRIIWPLIAAGIFRFKEPWFFVCENCEGKAREKISSVATLLGQAFAGQFKLDQSVKKGFKLDTGNAFDPPVYWGSARRNEMGFAQIVNEFISDELYSALRATSRASQDGSVIFSNSRLGISGLLKLESVGYDEGVVELLDRGRSFDVPWVTELNAQQILQLREEAAAALPRFREVLAKNLCVRNDEAIATDGAEFIFELRERAAEVRSELDVARKRGARFWKAGFGILGFSLSAYGVYSGNAISAVSGLLPILQMLISHETGQEKDVAKLQAMPGFVLVKAQDILAHAD
jgi:hypothetical protein